MRMNNIGWCIDLATTVIFFGHLYNFISAPEWSVPAPMEVLQNISATTFAARLSGLKSLLLSGFRSLRGIAAH